MSTSVFREVFGMCVFVLAITAMVIGVSCKPAEPAQPKFVSLPQETAGNFHGNVLTKRMNESNWKIFYGFSDNNHCGNQFTGDHLAKLNSKVLESIEVWLSPLSDKEGVIALENITLELRDTIPAERATYTADIKERTFDTEGEEPHLSIVFYCTVSRSFARVGGNNLEIHMFQKEGLSTDKAATDLLKYRSTTIHHEMGHAFGLGDTYVDRGEDSCWSQRFNRSKGGHDKTVGMQPLSVMSLHRINDVAQDIHTGELKLSLDDIAGIKWLYRYYFEKIEACDCPYEYVYEVDSGGCRPKYPVIFAAKQGRLAVLLHLDSINVQDEFGNTALHYMAANEGHVDDYVSFFGVLDSKEITYNHKSTNNLGHTADDIHKSKEPDKLQLLYRHNDIDEAEKNHQQEIAETCKWMEFMLAVRDHNENSVMELLNENSVMELLDVVDINKQDYYGYTALHYAAGSLNVAMTRVLLAHNSIDIYVSTHAGYTPFGLLMLDGSDDELKKCAEGSGLDYLTNQYDPNNLYDSIRSDRRMPEICPTILDRNSLPYYDSENLYIADGLGHRPSLFLRWCDVVMLFLQKK